MDKILSVYSGTDMDLSDLRQVSDLITDAYRKKGYITARAYVPQQEIAEGIVEITVLEGKLGEIFVKGNKNYSDEFIRRGFTRVRNDAAIRYSALETSLLLLNEYPDLKATALLQAGHEPGTTDLSVNVEDKLPLDVTLDYNNFGSEFVSRHRFGAEVVLSKFLIPEGSSFSIRGIMGSDPSDLLFGRSSYVLPINNYGTKLGLSFYGGDFVVGREFAELEIRGKTWGYTASLTHPFIKTRFQNLTGEFGFESEDTKQFLLGSLSTRDKIRLLKAGLNYDRSDSTGRNFIWLSFYQGLGDALGAMENHDPKSSRTGADNRFTKATLILARYQKLGESVSLVLRGSGQASTDSLVAGRQFAVGGPDSVRGYPEGEFLGDDGYNISTELRIAPLLDKEMAHLAFFVDHGGVSTKRAPAGTKRYHHLTGAGYGLRLNLPYNFNARFDVGFPIEPSKASTGDHPTFYIQAMVKF